MKRYGLKRRFATGALAGTMALGLGAAAFASDQVQTDVAVENSLDSREDGYERERGPKGGGERLAVEKLVESGAFSQDTADRIEEHMASKRETENGEKPDFRGKDRMKDGKLLKELLENGIITEAEKEAIEEQMESQRAEMENRRHKELLDSGIFTEDDLDNIESYLEEKRAEKEIDREKIEEMTGDERRTYFEENRKARKSFEDEMLEDGVITEEQAEYMKENREQRGEERMGKRESEKPRADVAQ